MKHALVLAAATAALSLTACATSETMSGGSMSGERAMMSLAPPHAPIVEGKPVPVTASTNQEAILDAGGGQLAANKRAVYDLWRNVLIAGHVEAADTYMQPGYIQHNPTAPTGREAFKSIFERFVPRQDTVPPTIPNMITMIAEDDMVVASFVRTLPDPTMEGATYTTTQFDMFRMEDGKLAEHWDIAQLGPGANPPPADQGGPVPVTGLTGTAQLALLESDDPVLAEHKRIVFDVWRSIVDAGHEELAPQWIDEGYIQHNPNAGTGRAGMMAYFATRPDKPIADSVAWPIIDIVAEGDLVAIGFVRELPKPGSPGETYTTAWFDMFRFENGKIAEHWDIAEKGAPSPTETRD